MKRGKTAWTRDKGRKKRETKQDMEKIRYRKRQKQGVVFSPVGYEAGRRRDFERRRCNRSGALFIALYLHSSRVTRDFSRPPSSSFPVSLGGTEGETCWSDSRVRRPRQNIPPHRHEKPIRPGPAVPREFMTRRIFGMLVAEKYPRQPMPR